MTHSHEHQHDGADSGSPESYERPEDFWEELYTSADSIWSGSVNVTLASVVAELTPGRSLDLGCGEGGDVMWLAEHGWDAMGIDLSQTAVDRAQRAAEARALPNARFVRADLTEWAERPAAIDGGADPFDLVTASFFQSPVELQRQLILRAAAARVAVGGHLVLISHAAAPGGASEDPAHFVTPEGELETLALDESSWRVLVSEVRTRSAENHPSGAHTLDDTVVVAQRVA